MGRDRGEERGEKQRAPRRYGAKAVGLILLVALLAIVLWAVIDGVNTRTAGTRYGVLNLDFGYRQLPVTRSVQRDLCPSDDTTGPQFPECSEATGTPQARPAVVSVGLEGDLAEVDDERPILKATRKVASDCNRLPRGTQFPATQVKLAAENRGATALALSATGDTAQPEEVRPGTYCGIVTVERAAGEPARYYILASVGDRGQGALRVRVFAALLIGALTGALVKWLGDRYAPVVSLRRRQRRLLRRMGAWLRFLPERAQYDFEIVDDGIRAYDGEGVDDALKELELHGDSLTEFGQAIAELDRLLEIQQEFLDTTVDPPVATVIAAQSASAARLRAERFPWAEPERVAAEATQLRNLAKALAIALRTGDLDSYQAAAQTIVAAQTSGPFAPRGVDYSSALLDMTAIQREISTGPQNRNVSQRLLDNALLITMVVGALVVALVGYQVEFVNDATFDAGNGDYLRLFAWAFALQVAGVTVLEVAGKLVVSRPSGSGSPDSG